MKYGWRQYGPIALTIVFLVYLGAFADLTIATRGREEFFEASRRAIDAVPMELGPGWTAQRRTLEARTLDLLQPNAHALVRYSYQGRIDVDLSVVQVKDGRFMTGHAPTNCYPNQGYTIDSQVERVWKVGKDRQFEIRGKAYSMRRRGETGVQYETVYSFFIFPDGRMGWTLDHLDRFAEDYRKLAYGVAQVMVVTYGQQPHEQRDRLFETIMGQDASLEMLRVLQAGIPR